MDLLSGLPEELIDGICAYLENEDLKKLRFCCKQIKVKSLHAFDNRFVGIVRFILTRQSLQQLIGLSKNLWFQEAIEELQLCLVVFHDRTKSTITSDPIVTTTVDVEQIQNMKVDRALPTVTGDSQLTEYNKKLKRRRRRLHDKYRHEQNTMKTTGTDVELLAEALGSLSSLKKISTVEKYDQRHPPLGAREIYEEIGIWPSSASALIGGHEVCKSDEILQNSMHAVPVVFGALLRSGCQPEVLDLCAVPYGLPLAKTTASRKRSRISTPAKTFARNQFEELKLPNLQHLSLRLYYFERQRTAKLYLDSTLKPLWWVTALLPAISSVKKLTIMGAESQWVERDFGYGNNTNFDHAVDQLNTKSLRFLADNDARLPLLCNLELQHIEVDADLLQSILRKHDIRKIQIHHRIRGSPSPTILCALRSSSTLLYADVEMYARRSTYEQRHRGKVKYVIHEKTNADFQTKLESTISSVRTAAPPSWA